MPIAETDAPVVRDIRVDEIGYADELKRQHIDNLRTGVKSTLIEKGAVRVEGDLFEGVMYTPNEKTVSVEKWFKKYERGEMTKKQLFASLKVSVTEATKIAGAAAVAKISTITPQSPRLTITRKEGVEVALVDALAGLTTAIGVPQR